VSAAAVERDGLTLELRDGPKLVFGDLRGLEAKWAAASRVLADPGSEGATYVDVRVPERPAAGGLAPMGEGPADEPTVPTAPTTPTTPPAAPQSTPPAAQTTPPATAQPGTSGAPTAQVGQPSTSGTG
jgi:cell division protein FtsQ